jgi:plasmid stability protein
MRTTLTLDDDLAQALKERAFRTDSSFKAVVNEALRAGLAAGEAPPRPRRYRLKPVSLGGVRPGIDLDRALTLAESLEDREIGRKLEQRK